MEPDLVGTVTLTTNQLGFTWAGPSLTVADVKKGDTIILPAKGGLQAIVESVTSPTAGTISNMAPAAIAGAAQPARLRFQSDLSRVKAELTNLVALLKGGNLTALAGLDGTGGNWLPYLTGAGLMGRTAFTPFARTLLDDASATDVLNTLNVIGNAQAVRLPGGMILQWNSTNVNVWDAEGAGTIPLLTSYSSASSYTVLAAYTSPSTEAARRNQVMYDTTLPRTASQFSVRLFNAGTGVAGGAGVRVTSWIAVGY